MQLKNAGDREHRFAQHLITTHQLPKEVSFRDFLNWGVYDPHEDEVGITIGGCYLSWPVQLVEGGE